MRGLPVPEMDSPHNFLLLEMQDRERREKEEMMNFLITLVATPALQNSAVPAEDRQKYIMTVTERMRSVIFQTKYTDQYLIRKLKKQYAEKKRDQDMLDMVGGLG